MRKFNIILSLLLSIPVVGISQYRSVAMVFQFETTEETIPSLFYMFRDSVIYDLGKGKEGFYNECIPAKMVNNDAAFVIQDDNKWKKIVTVEQLEEQGAYSDGTITLTLLKITRIPCDAPDDPREYKTPPHPYHRALLSEDGLPLTDSKLEAYKSARSYFGLKVDKRIKPALFEENWNMKGEGEIYIIYEFDSISNELFLKKNKLLDYQYLPIKEKTPLYAPKSFSNYIPSDLYHQFYILESHDFIDHPGKYKITCKKRKNVVVSSIVIYDEELMKLLLFYCVDYE